MLHRSVQSDRPSVVFPSLYLLRRRLVEEIGVDDGFELGDFLQISEEAAGMDALAMRRGIDTM